MDSDATSMAPATGDETMVVPAGTDPLLNTERQQLAYSLDPDLEPAGEVTAYGPAAAAEAGYVDTGYDDYGYEDGYEEEPEQRDRRPLLIGSTVAAFMIVGFATLAVSVAVSIKPTSSAQALRLQDDAVPGKYFPVAPGQGVQPDGNAWTMIEEAAPATGAAVGTPAVRTFQPLALGPSTQTAAQTAAQTVRVYPDGAMTVGGAPVPAVTPAVPDAGTAVGAVIPGAVPGVIVPRAPILTSLIIGNVLREAVQLGPLNPNNYNTKPKPGDQFNVDPGGVLPGGVVARGVVAGEQVGGLPGVQREFAVEPGGVAGEHAQLRLGVVGGVPDPEHPRLRERDAVVDEGERVLDEAVGAGIHREQHAQGVRVGAQ